MNSPPFPYPGGATRAKVSRSWQRWLGEVRESFLMGMAAVAAHKLRSALTLLGVLIGVFSIIIVMTTMRAMQHQIEEDIAQLGGQTFQIDKWPGVYFGGDEGFERYWRRKNITFAQARQLQAKATLPQQIGMESYLWRGEMVSPFEKTPPDVPLLGETPGSFPAKNWNVVEGRGITESDLDSTRDICVLGHGLARTLFPFGSSVGQRIKFNGLAYTVVGVLERKGTSKGSEQDNFAVIPLTTGLNRYGRRWMSISILVQARNGQLYEDTVEEVRGIFRSIRKVAPGDPDDFEVFSNDSMIEQFKKVTFAVRLGVSFVSSIALIAAGIGIMNIMLVSVTERTREIGVRRAVGAKKRNIMAQFIMEAIVICELGGIAGVLLGIVGGNIAAHFLKLTAVFPLDWAIIGLVICSLVGIVFGTYPAYKAANLDPIESLRYE